MGYELDYSAISNLVDEFGEMDKEFKSRIRQTARKIGQQLKKNTENYIPREAVAKWGVHMADDVKMSVKVTDKKTSITVRGGKKTGSLWFIVDNGHVTRNGKFVPGVHFTDKAYNATEVEGPVDNLIQEILNE